MVRNPDVVIVGGGPAGLATAIAARGHGLGVTVLERSAPPIDKACGEGLMPDGVELLARLGIPREELGGRPFAGIRYFDGDVVAAGRFPRGTGLAVRRTQLHQALAARAETVGVRLLWRRKAVALAGHEVRTGDGERHEARWLVAADGLRSAVRRWVGADRPPVRPWRFGVRRHFAIAPWSELVEVYWGPRGEAYVSPVGPETVGIAMLWRGGKASFDELLAGFPDLATRLRGAPAASRDRGAGPFRQRARRVVVGHLALVGDAAGYLDAITGEGLSLAFHQASALAEALAAGDLARYARAHRRLVRLPELLMRTLLVAERHPRWRRRLMRALAADPELFDQLLGLNCRQVPLRAVRWGRLLRLLLAGP